MPILNWRRADEAALQDAKALLEKYGADVKDWVESGLCHPDPKHRRWVQQIATALQRMSIDSH